MYGNSMFGRIISFDYIIIVLLLALLSACGGGGSDSTPATSDVEISGAILVPGGTDSADNPLGLQGAANRPVSLYRIDNDGNIIDDVLDSTTSDQTGNYVLLLPSNFQFSSDIIVEADLGNNETARAIVIDESTDITPITEYITSKLIADPNLSLDALPLAEVIKLVEFVESLPLGPEPDLSAMLTLIASFSDLAIEAEINDLATANPQIRLSGLLSVPAPASTSPRGSGIALRSEPVPDTVVELYRIDNNGNPIGSPIASTQTNAEGVFTFLLPVGETLSGDLMLQAVVSTDTIRALVTSELLNINAESQFIYGKIFQEPAVVPADLDVEELSAIILFVNSADCTETDDLASTLASLETCVGPEVDIQVDNAVNDAPTGATLVVAAVEETPTAIDISGNVTDGDGTVNLSTTTVITGPSNGSLINNNDGSFSYTGATDFFGNDSFTYTVADNDGLVSASITVNINVSNANDAPTGTTLVVAAVEETPTAIDISGNVTDVDGTVNLSTTTVVAGPSNGSLINNNDGSFSYNGATDFFGNDSFTYTVADNDGLVSASITVNINVSNANDAPVIGQTGPLVVVMDEDASPIAFVAPTITATDIDSGVLTWSGTPATNGTATVGGSGASPTITYAPNPDFNGNDSFDVTVNDGAGGSDVITVTVSVNAQNDLPTISGDPPVVAVSGVLYSFTPTAEDIDGETLSFSIQNQPSWATASFNTADGTFSGTPGPTDVGGDFSGIVISVTAGVDTVPLAAFSITVNAAPVSGAVWDQFNWDDGSTWQ